MLRAQAPTSAKPGDKAVVTADGQIHGWIGGGCAQPAVLKTVRQALADGQAARSASRRPTKPPSAALGDVLEFGMACHSGGTLELFVDPVLPRDPAHGVRRLAGGARAGGPGAARGPAGDAGGRRRRAPATTRMRAPCSPATTPAACVAQLGSGGFAVVATQGRRDLHGLNAALALRARHLWFVASARKAEVLRQSLIAAGEDADRVAAHRRAGRRIDRRPDAGRDRAVGAGGGGGGAPRPRPMRHRHRPASAVAAAANRLRLERSQARRQQLLLRERQESWTAANGCGVDGTRRGRVPSRRRQKIVLRELTWAAFSKVAAACTADWWSARCCWPRARARAWATGPRCLLELGGVPLIRRQLIALSGAGVDELVVVLGHYADQIEPAVQDFPVTLVRNPDPDAGQVSSLRLGLQALSPKIDAVLVALADQPLINSQDINDLIGAYKKRPEGAQVVQPTVDGQPGNPVMFSGDVREQILAGEAARRLQAMAGGPRRSGAPLGNHQPALPHRRRQPAKTSKPWQRAPATACAGQLPASLT